MTGTRPSPLVFTGGDPPRETPPTTSCVCLPDPGFPCPFDDAPPPPLCPFVESPAVADCSHTSQCSETDDADLTSLSDAPAGPLPPYHAITRRRASGFDTGGPSSAGQSSTSPHRSVRIVRPRPVGSSLSGSDTVAAVGGASSLHSVRTTTGVLMLRRSPPPPMPPATPPSKTLAVPATIAAVGPGPVAGSQLSGTDSPMARRSSRRRSAVVVAANAIPAVSVTVGRAAISSQRPDLTTVQVAPSEPKGAGPERSYTKLFVGQIPASVNAKPWLAELFAPFNVREILVRGHSERATAFVWCGSRDHAEAAVAALNGYKYENNNMWYSLCVEPSKSSFK